MDRVLERDVDTVVVQGRLQGFGQVVEVQPLQDVRFLRALQPTKHRLVQNCSRTGEILLVTLLQVARSFLDGGPPAFGRHQAALLGELLARDQAIDTPFQQLVLFLQLHAVGGLLLGFLVAQGLCQVVQGLVLFDDFHRLEQAAPHAFVKLVVEQLHVQQHIPPLDDNQRRESQHHGSDQHPNGSFLHINNKISNKFKC